MYALNDAPYDIVITGLQKPLSLACKHPAVNTNKQGQGVEGVILRY